MKRALGLVSLVLLFSPACGGPTQGQPATTGSPTGGEGGGSQTNAATGKTCVQACTSAADCATGTLAVYDASHFACNSGKCEWQGCKSTADCTSALQTMNVACGTSAGSPVPDCIPTCATAADCATTNNALYDASHFACNAGLCEWQGCKSTTECTTAYQSSKFSCEKAPGATIADCEPTCAADADCAMPGSPLYDASHFSCNSGRCEWKGCRSTAECRSALQNNKLVCE